MPHFNFDDLADAFMLASDKCQCKDTIHDHTLGSCQRKASRNCPIYVQGNGRQDIKFSCPECADEMMWDF